MLLGYERPSSDTIDGFPYWRVSVRPNIYQENRIDVSRCFNVLESMAVRAGGWRYPFVSRKGDRLNVRGDHVEAHVESGDIREFSRLYRSGQFLYVTVLREAFNPDVLEAARESARWNQRNNGVEPTGGIHIVRLMRLASVAFLNTKTLVEQLNLEVAVQVSLKLANVRGNVLISDPMHELDECYQTLEASVETTNQYSPEDLLTKPAVLAVSAVRDIVATFRWFDPDDLVLRGFQEMSLA